MMSFMKKLAPLGLALVATTASAQDAGNLVAALDHGTANLNDTTQSLLAADVGGTLTGAQQLTGDLVVDLADGSPLEAIVGGSGGLPTDELLGGGLPVDGLPIDGLPLDGDLPLAGLGLPSLADGGSIPATALLSPSTFARGIPVIHGEEVILFTEPSGIGANLRRSGIPLGLFAYLMRVDLLGPGDNDGGGVLLPIAGNGESALPVVTDRVVGTLGELPQNLDGTPFILTDSLRLIDFVAANPLSGSALPVPVIGMVIGDGAYLPFIGTLPLADIGGLGGSGLPGLSGLGLSELPLPLDTLDATTVTALTGGATLPGL